MQKAKLKLISIIDRFWKRRSRLWYLSCANFFPNIFVIVFRRPSLNTIESIVFWIISKISKLLKFPKKRRLRDQRRKHFTKSSLLQQPIKYLSPEDTLYLWYSTIKYPWEKMSFIRPLENTVSLVHWLNLIHGSWYWSRSFSGCLVPSSADHFNLLGPSFPKIWTTDRTRPSRAGGPGNRALETTANPWNIILQILLFRYF